MRSSRELQSTSMGDSSLTRLTRKMPASTGVHARKRTSQRGVIAATAAASWWCWRAGAPLRRPAPGGSWCPGPYRIYSLCSPWLLVSLALPRRVGAHSSTGQPKASRHRRTSALTASTLGRSGRAARGRRRGSAEGPWRFGHPGSGRVRWRAHSPRVASHPLESARARR